jgi:ferredoxin, 2Fe-2S
MTAPESAAVNHVLVEPLGEAFEVNDGETVLDAALRQRFWWPQVCMAQARCRTCWVWIADGHENTLPREDLEDAALQSPSWRADVERGNIRLACQLRVRGPVVVERRGVRGPNER